MQPVNYDLSVSRTNSTLLQGNNLLISVVVTYIEVLPEYSYQFRIYII
jgi:hypothetical protein